MTTSILFFLLQDGITTGAAYALIGLSLVLLFAVTRVIFLPQGEFVAYGALTLSMLERGAVPGTVSLLLALGFAAAALDLWADRKTIRARNVLTILAGSVALPIAIYVLVHITAPLQMAHWLKILLALIIVVPMGPYVYSIAFRRLEESSILVKLIAAVSVHLALVGIGLHIFGPEGSRTEILSSASFNLGEVVVTGQAVVTIVATLVVMLILYVTFDFTYVGKSLRAVAVNRLGARLVGIAPGTAGRIVFAVAALIGALCGILISPMATIYYNTGFLIGLKGFVAAIIAALVSYPITAIAALAVGIIEAFVAFYASAFKEVVVFMIIIPVLLWRSVGSKVVEEDDH